jgi:glycosyltransferase involved in cell wall biosynthesis
MKILSLTAGAASMYCGSCLRDNALAAELIRLGHDVTLLPFYTPTLTDEENVSRQQRVFFGGISVYLEQHMPWYRRGRLLDQIVDAPRVIRAFTSGSIAVDPKQLGAMTVSTLRGVNGNQRKEIDKLIEFVTAEAAPDVINIPYTLLIGLAAPLKRAVGRPIVVTLQGEDLFLEGTPEPYRTEALDLIRAQVADVDLFIAVSEYYARFMRDYLRIPESKMRVATLGVNTKDLSITPRPPRFPVPDSQFPAGSEPFTIGFFARIAPEKGLHNLADAYRILRTEKRLPPSRLLAAGYLAPEHKPYLEKIAASLRAAGLGGEFVYRGAVDRANKIRFFHEIDVLSVPSGYHEPKGLYLLEAMACGVPVVQPSHGAFPEIIARTGGGVLAKSESGADIAEAIFELWKDPARAAALGRAGAEGVRRHYTVQHMATGVLKAYQDAQREPSVQALSHARR